MTNMNKNQNRISVTKLKSSNGKTIGYIDREGQQWHSIDQLIAMFGKQHKDRIMLIFNDNKDWKITDTDFGVKVYPINSIDVSKLLV
jgi:hypothetical protein